MHPYFLKDALSWKLEMTPTAYLFLFITITAEVIGVGFLKETREFTRLGPSVIVVISYAVTLYCLALVMKTVPVSIAYALWAAFGIVFVVLIGAFYYKEPIDMPAVIGTALIIAGMVVVNLFSKTLH